MPGAFPELVEPANFDRVQELLKSRAPRVVPPARVGSQYLLSGLIRCGSCGASMFGHAAKSGKYHYYVCATSHRNGKQLCNSAPIPRALIEDQVLDRLRSLILKEEHLEELVRLTNQELESSLDGVNARLNALDSQTADVDRRLERLYDALETGKLELDDLAPRIKELKGRRELLQRSRCEVEETLVDGRIELVSREVVLGYLGDFNLILDGGSVSERRAFLRSFIESIRAKDSQVTIRYTLPLPPERVQLDALGVLVFDSLGGAGGTRTTHRK